MLNGLKRFVRDAEETDLLMESVTEASKARIKDVFLDDPEAVVIGAENDPEIEKLLKKVPEYGEIDAGDIEALKKLEESLLEVDGGME